MAAEKESHSKEKCTTFISQIHTSHSIRNTKPAQLIQTVSQTSIKNNGGQFKKRGEKTQKQTDEDAAFNNKHLGFNTLTHTV